MIFLTICFQTLQLYHNIFFQILSLTMFFQPVSHPLRAKVFCFLFLSTARLSIANLYIHHHLFKRVYHIFSVLFNIPLYIFSDLNHTLFYTFSDLNHTLFYTFSNLNHTLLCTFSDPNHTLLILSTLFLIILFKNTYPTAQATTSVIENAHHINEIPI